MIIHDSRFVKCAEIDAELFLLSRRKAERPRGGTRKGARSSEGA